MIGLEDQLADRSLGLATEIEPGKPLLLFFGGIAGGFGIPLFEFAKLAVSFDASKVFVRDLRQAWYQRGIPGVGRDVSEVCIVLERTIAAASPSRVVTVGNSAGGFAALLFGSLLGVDEVHAFAPQTFLGPVARLQARDFRNRRAALRLLTVRDRRYMDLRPHLRGRLNVHYSASDRLDVIHADHVADRAVLHEHGGGGHLLVKVLRDDGTLQRLLSSALGATGAPADVSSG